MVKHLLILLGVAFIASGATATTALELTVSISGLASNAGDVHVALYDKAEGFPESDSMLVGIEVPVANRSARTVFRDLPAGRYAVAVYHDENANDEFDQGPLGISLEDFGFSNGAVVFFGPPSFEDASVALAEPSGLVIIDLGN